MKNYHYLLYSLLSIAFTSYAMEHRVTAIENLTTKIIVEDKGQPLYNLLRYPPCNFEKTDIVHIITDPNSDVTTEDNEIFQKPRLIQVIKQGLLDSLTKEDIDNIREGKATYHYDIKSSLKDSTRMDIGALAIDKEVYSINKKKWDFQREHDLICQTALVKRIIKEKNSANASETKALGL